MIGIAGSRESTYRKYGYGAAMQVQIDTSILGTCGLRNVGFEVSYDVEQSPENRARYLDQGRGAGARVSNGPKDAAGAGGGE